MRCMIEGASCLFDHRAFDLLVGRRRPGVFETLDRLSKTLCVSISSLKKWRRGDHAPSDFDKMRDLASALDIDIGMLLKREKEKWVRKLRL